jgi:hypothetical protein
MKRGDPSRAFFAEFILSLVEGLKGCSSHRPEGGTCTVRKYGVSLREDDMFLVF